MKLTAEMVYLIWNKNEIKLIRNRFVWLEFKDNPVKVFKSFTN